MDTTTSAVVRATCPFHPGAWLRWNKAIGMRNRWDVQLVEEAALREQQSHYQTPLVTRTSHVQANNYPLENMVCKTVKTDNICKNILHNNIR